MQHFLGVNVLHSLKQLAEETLDLSAGEVDFSSLQTHQIVLKILKHKESVASCGRGDCYP